MVASEIENMEGLKAPLHQLVQTLQVEERDSIRTVQAAIDDAKSILRTPWLARTQWLERYVGVDMVQLSEMTE